jgi:hypothetical protein
MKNVFVFALVALMAACASSDPKREKFGPNPASQANENRAPSVHEAPTPNQGVRSNVQPSAVRKAPQSDAPVVEVQGKLRILDCNSEQLCAKFQQYQVVCTVEWLMQKRGIQEFDLQHIPLGCSRSGDVILGGNSRTIGELQRYAKYNKEKSLNSLLEKRKTRDEGVRAELSPNVDDQGPNYGKKLQIEFLMVFDPFLSPQGGSYDDLEQIVPALEKMGIRYETY